MAVWKLVVGKKTWRHGQYLKLEVERADFFRARAELGVSSPDELELSQFHSRAYSEPRLS